MGAFGALRRTPSILMRSPSVIVTGVVVAALVGIEGRVELSGVTTTAFEIMYILVFAFVLGGVYGTVSEAVESGRGDVSDFMSSAVPEFPVLAAGFLLIYAVARSVVWIGGQVSTVAGDDTEALTGLVDFDLAFLFLSFLVSLAFVSAMVVLFVFQFFGVAVVTREGNGFLDRITGGLSDSARFVSENLGSVVEYVFFSVALFAVLAVVFVVLPAVGVFLISSKGAAMEFVAESETLPVLTTAVFSVIFYTYQTVYYRSLAPS